MDNRWISDHLEWVDGIWFGRRKTGISFPPQGHDGCFSLEETSFWFRHRSNCIIETLRLFPPQGPVFDVGGGNGYVSRILEDNGIETVLVEPVKSGALNAKKRGLNHIICATLEDAQFKPNTLPAIGLFDVLEHIRDHRDFLETVCQLLEPGGRLYITVPAFAILWSAEDELAGHFRRWTVRSLVKQLEEAGFQVEYATYIFSLLPLPIFLFRSLPYRWGWIKKSAWQNRYREEHSPGKGLPGNLLEMIWKIELKRISKKKTIPFGSSCLVTASLPNVTGQGKTRQ
jgi:SAM-dependent methyltransferase